MLRELGSKDEKLRAAAAEGLGQDRESGGRAGARQSLAATRTRWRLASAAAFALVMEAAEDSDLSEEGPLRYLINTLNQPHITMSLTPTWWRRRGGSRYWRRCTRQLADATTDEKIYLARVLAVSGDKSSIP